uniref:Uncharacterized protein n=1 Tax=Oryza sativa subsp. japonica TaxID=39947 RepID=Q6Z3S3_ORYSJ|nr:hypothetical protein [Oryza sativa Japonica Group]
MLSRQEHTPPVYLHERRQPSPAGLDGSLIPSRGNKARPRPAWRSSNPPTVSSESTPSAMRRSSVTRIPSPRGGADK